MNVLLTLTCSFALGGLAAVFVFSKCLFLHPYRLGWLMLVTNLMYEVAERKFKCRRMWVDQALYLAVVAGSWVLFGTGWALLVALLLAYIFLWALVGSECDHSWRLMRPYGTLCGSVPLPVPQLIVTVRGPILRRDRRVYDLGDWPEGLKQTFDVIILNPSIIRPQLPLSIDVENQSGDALLFIQASEEKKGCPEPGEIVRYQFDLMARQCGQGGTVRISVRHGDFIWQRSLTVRRIWGASEKSVAVAARIQRWKYGASGAFVWRGDQDLYDPSTFQSEEGLRVALGLARRFRMPSSLMLSSRLSLVQKEHEAFCKHHGWERKSQEIPSFISFLREEVDLEVEQEWPTATRRPFSVELGNHMHLHYGTHAAADANNGWKSHSRIGEGNYPWLGRYPCSSFEEQRDNISEGSRILQETLGIRATSFTIPSDVYDQQTARAAESAGIEVVSESDCGKWVKQISLPPPHHPDGCETVVELTRMSPRDPENIFQLAMVKFWVNVARRTGRVLVFLAHHHLARYEGEACHRLTEELMRYVLTEGNGDIYIGTLTAVGRYWRDVLSERTRRVTVSLEAGRITVENRTGREWRELPLEISLQDGGRYMRLVSVPSHASITLEV